MTNKLLRSFCPTQQPQAIPNNARNLILTLARKDPTVTVGSICFYSKNVRACYAAAPITIDAKSPLALSVTVIL